MEMTVKRLNEYLTTPLKEFPLSDGSQIFEYKDASKLITCRDGTTLSVQTGESLYCKPRDNAGPWTHVEVGFPSVAPPDTWADYFDGEWAVDDPTDSVYGYIPIKLVVHFINDHRGMRT